MKTSFNASLLILIAAVPLHALAADIERPKIEIVDKLHVNVATGQVTHDIDTVGIGGVMGLTHGVSIFANELVMKHNFGFNDRFWSETRYVRISHMLGHPTPNVYRVSDSTGSADFRLYVNGAPVLDFVNTPPPYSYVPIGDERNSLVSNNDELIWTKTDGTVVKFQRAPNAAAGATGRLKQIIAPSGFTISIASALRSVNTNTGFQLKYLYVADDRPMNKPDNPDLINAPPASTSAQSGWSSRNPKYIKAINNAVEYCAPAAATCTLDNAWPTATFDWPAGMPRSIYIGASQATIADAEGAVARFDIRAFDLAGQGYVPNREFSPRLVGFTPFGGLRPQFVYEFKNLFMPQAGGIHGNWSARAQTAGVIKTATNLQRTVGYSMMDPYMYGAYFNRGIGGGVNRVLMSPGGALANPDTLSYAETEDGTVHFEAGERNFPIRFEKLSGPWESYEYTRSNLARVSVRTDEGRRVHREAGYPASCTETTRKTCNQAEWIKDANGNTTYYAYHPQSGLVASVTSPPNKSGIVAQTRYEYAQLSARYFDGGAVKISGTPIWMKTAQKFCINSNYTNGACAGNDEAVARFEYDHDNLLLTGTTVTDPATGATRRTCYQYDIYARQIGTTRPRANLSRCN